MKTKTKYVWLVCIIAVVVSVDLLTKLWFGDISFTKIIPKLFHFETNHGNTGAAWGMLSGEKWLLISISVIGVIIFLAIDIFLIKSKSITYIIGLGFYLGGTIGNLIDRLVLGYVRDFINFTFLPSFPTFNFADSFLCVGAVIICVYLVFFYNRKKNGK